MLESLQQVARCTPKTELIHKTAAAKPNYKIGFASDINEHEHSTPPGRVWNLCAGILLLLAVSVRLSELLNKKFNVPNLMCLFEQ
jgi:hypothetical protein